MGVSFREALISLFFATVLVKCLDCKVRKGKLLVFLSCMHLVQIEVGASTAASA